MKNKIIIALIFIVGCGRVRGIPPQGEERTSNGSVSVELLFEKDGYKIYRFVDAGHYRYFVAPVGVVSSSFDKATGKSKTIITEEIQTVKP